MNAVILITLLIIAIVPVLNLPKTITRILSNRPDPEVLKERKQYAEDIANVIEGIDARNEQVAKAAMRVLCIRYTHCQTQAQEDLYFEVFGKRPWQMMCRRYDVLTNEQLDAYYGKI